MGKRISQAVLPRSSSVTARRRRDGYLRAEEDLAACTAPIFNRHCSSNAMGAVCRRGSRSLSAPIRSPPLTPKRDRRIRLDRTRTLHRLFRKEFYVRFKKSVTFRGCRLTRTQRSQRAGPADSRAGRLAGSLTSPTQTARSDCRPSSFRQCARDRPCRPRT